MAGCFSLEGIATVVALDAKKRRYYLGLYRDGERLCEDIDGNAPELVDRLRGEEMIAITGPDAPAFAQKLKAELPDARLIVDSEGPRPLGRMLLTLGKRQYEREGADDIGQGPVYIRRSDAEEALLERQKKEKGN